MNGILVVNKESGYTSRDVVNVLNHVFQTKKIGHTGTLDPIASGVLVVCIGKYTKLVEKITNHEKEYVANIALGIKTDTLDTAGTILEKEEPQRLTEEEIMNVLNSFLGKSKQEVPSYSAIKINGKKLYEYARENKSIELPKREIEVKEIKLLEYKDNHITFSCVVSKGTYIRSLIRDICEKLQVLGTMSDLIRIKQGNFTIQNSYTLDEIKKENYQLLTLENLFSCPRYSLTTEEYQKVKNGNTLNLPETSEEILLEYHHEIVALYEKKGEFYKPCLVL